jgi:hypothetical protein
MCDSDDVLAGVLGHDPLDRPGGAVVEIHETFAAGRGLVDVGKPMAADRPAGDEGGAVHPLPLSEMLLGKRCFLCHRRRLRKTGRPERMRGLMRAHQIARDPDCIARQDFRHRLEYLDVGGIAGNIGLAVDIAAVAAHRRMAHPPPPRRDHLRLVFIGHRDALSFAVLSLYVRRRVASSHSQVTSTF